ncbi:MAG: hypothetical protein F6K19_01465 [Cyanothece sp. SIO1E1]|nr:hypothetical protein [Cyanothece sp. SIO1E1]
MKDKVEKKLIDCKERIYEIVEEIKQKEDFTLSDVAFWSGEMKEMLEQIHGLERFLTGEGVDKETYEGYSRDEAEKIINGKDLPLTKLVRHAEWVVRFHERSKAFKYLK